MSDLAALVLGAITVLSLTFYFEILLSRSGFADRVVLSVNTDRTRDLAKACDSTRRMLLPPRLSTAHNHDSRTQPSHLDQPLALSPEAEPLAVPHLEFTCCTSRFLPSLL